MVLIASYQPVLVKILWGLGLVTRELRERPTHRCTLERRHWVPSGHRVRVNVGLTTESLVRGGLVRCAGSAQILEFVLLRLGCRGARAHAGQLLHGVGLAHQTKSIVDGGLLAIGGGGGVARPAHLGNGGRRAFEARARLVALAAAVGALVLNLVRIDQRGFLGRGGEHFCVHGGAGGFGLGGCSDVGFGDSHGGLARDPVTVRRMAGWPPELDHAEL